MTVPGVGKSYFQGSHGWNMFHPESMKMGLVLTSLRDWG